MEILIFAIIAGVLALIFAAFRAFAVVREDQGNETMQRIARAIQLGAATFLKREYAVLAVFVVAVFVVLLVFIDLDVLDKNPMESRFWNFESDAPAMAMITINSPTIRQSGESTRLGTCSTPATPWNRGTSIQLT